MAIIVQLIYYSENLTYLRMGTVNEITNE